MAVKDAFSTRLRKLREVAGLTQAQLAEYLGVSRGSISYYENCERVPDIELLDNICSFFEVSLNYMTGYADARVENNEAIRLRLGLSEKAVEKLEDCEISGEALSLLLESDAFTFFMKKYSELLDVAKDKDCKYIYTFESHYEIFLFTQLLTHLLRDTLNKERDKTLNALTEDEFIQRISRALSEHELAMEKLREFKTEVDSMRFHDTIDNENSEYIERTRITRAVHDYLRQLEKEGNENGEYN